MSDFLYTQSILDRQRETSVKKCQTAYTDREAIQYTVTDINNHTSARGATGVCHATRMLRHGA